MVIKRSRRINSARTKSMNFRRLYRKTIPSTRYFTHGIHKYTAKLIPHIPRYLIKKYTKKNDLILDPFCGSGTVLLEAILLSRNAIGIDLNPLAALISEAKATPLDIDKLSLAIRLVKENVKKSDARANVEFPNLDYWFCKKAQNELSKIKGSIENLNGRFNKSIYRFLLVCFSSIIRKSSYADPRMAKTYKSKRVVEKIKKGWTPTPILYFEESLDRNFAAIKSLSKHLNTNSNYVKSFQGDAREISTILKQNGIEEVDLIITSPPYINAQDYFRIYKLEIWWLGLATPEEVRHLNKEAIGTECVSGIDYNSIPKSKSRILNRVLREIWKNSEDIEKKEKIDEKTAKKKEKVNKKKVYVIHDYFEHIKSVFGDFYDILKIGGQFCLISGNNTICGVRIPTCKILTQAAENNGFKLVEIGRDKIRNRSLAPDRNHDGGVIKEEWITTFQKG